MRIVHWNVHSWTDDVGVDNAERVLELIRRVDADVACLVEVDEPVAGQRRIDSIAAALGAQVAFAPAVTYGEGRRRGEFGNAIVTRLPLQEVREHTLLWPPPVYDGTELSEQRNLVLVQVETVAGLVWIGSTHLPRGDPEARVVAGRRLSEAVHALDKQAPIAWLVVGDFNSTAATVVAAHPGWRAHPVGVATYPAQQPVECIDFAVTTAGLDVDAEVLPVAGSDHLPLLIRLRPANHSGPHDPRTAAPYDAATTSAEPRPG